MSRCALQSSPGRGRRRRRDEDMEADADMETDGDNDGDGLSAGGGSVSASVSASGAGSMAAGGAGRRGRRRGRGENDSEISGEDLLGDNMMDDYREMDVLDQYDEALLDEREYAPLDQEARMAAEAALAERDRLEGRGRVTRLAAALESDEGK